LRARSGFRRWAIIGTQWRSERAHLSILVDFDFFAIAVAWLALLPFVIGKDKWLHQGGVLERDLQDIAKNALRLRNLIEAHEMIAAEPVDLSRGIAMIVPNLVSDLQHTIESL
jgi:hypothetical protein